MHAGCLGLSEQCLEEGRAAGQRQGGGRVEAGWRQRHRDVLLLQALSPQQGCPAAETALQSLVTLLGGPLTLWEAAFLSRGQFLGKDSL